MVAHFIVAGDLLVHLENVQADEKVVGVIKLTLYLLPRSVPTLCSAYAREVEA